MLSKRVFSLFLVFSILLSVFSFHVPVSASEITGTRYYVDSINGSDLNDGKSETRAWKSLERVNNANSFQPGDRILLKAGCTWLGQLWPKGSGNATAPIIIDMYGEGNKPIINAGGETTVSAVYLYNQEYWEIRNLEVTNKDTKEGQRCGILIEGMDYGDINHIYITDCYIHDIKGINEVNSAFTGGISLQIKGTTVKTKFNDVLIQDNSFYKADKRGITMASSWIRKIGFYPSTNVKIRSNSFDDCGMNAIVVRECDGAIVEYNVSAGAGTRTRGNGCGIWAYNSDNTVIQYNEAYNTNGYPDGQGFDCDYNCNNTLMQYNYSHDNAGGFMLICSLSTKSDDGSKYLYFNKQPVVRYNISQNDNRAVFHITGNVEDATIYNNTIYLSQTQTTEVYSFGDWGGFSAPINTKSYNNIFYNLGSGEYTIEHGSRKSTGTVFDYNAYYNKEHKEMPADANMITSDPMLESPGNGGLGILSVDGYKLKKGSPCIGAGVNIANNGGKDYWGNPVPVDGAPDIGANQTIPSAMVTPTITEEFDKASPKNICVDVNLLNNNLASISDASQELSKNDYSIESGKITFNASYLNTLPAGIQSKLTLNFEPGFDEVIAIPVNDTSITNSSFVSVSPTIFNKNSKEDIQLRLNLKGNTLNSIIGNGKVLTESTDYVVNSDILTIKKENLQSYETDTTVKFEFVFSSGDSEILAIPVIDTTPSMGSISSTTFDKYSPKDIIIRINTFEKSFGSLENNGYILTNKDYSIQGSTIIIKSAYLKSLQANSTYSIKIKFEEGDILTADLLVIDTRPPDNSLAYDWYKNPYTVTETIYGVASFGNEKFIVVGSNGTIKYTLDGGESWALSNSGTTNTLFSITQNDSSYVVVGAGERKDSPPTILFANKNTDGTPGSWEIIDASKTQGLLPTDKLIDLGSVIWSKDKFIAAGNKRYIITSPDGRTWTKAFAQSSYETGFKGLAANGDTILAVGQENARVLSADNGKTWRLQANPTPNPWVEPKLFSIAYNPQLSKFMVGTGIKVEGNNTSVYVTKDGKTVDGFYGNNKTAQGNDTGKGQIQGITVTNEKVIMVGLGGNIITSNATNLFFTSSNNIVPNDLYGVASDSTGLAIAVGSFGTIIRTSDGGETWTRLTGDINNTNYYGIEAYNGNLVAVGDNGSIIRKNTVTGSVYDYWDKTQNIISNKLNAIKWIDDKYIAVGNNGAILSATNEDGSNFTDALPNGVDTSTDIKAIATNGENIVLVGGVMNLTNDAGIRTTMVSTNGISVTDWTYSTLTNSNCLNDVMWVNTNYLGKVYLAVGDNERVLKSSNGTQWEEIYKPASVDGGVHLLTLAWDGKETFVVGGADGSILVSLDGGGYWRFISSLDIPEAARGKKITSVKYKGSQFVATTENGIIMTSLYGEIWKINNYSPIANLGLNSLVYDEISHRFVGIGNGGGITYSSPIPMVLKGETKEKNTIIITMNEGLQESTIQPWMFKVTANETVIDVTYAEAKNNIVIVSLGSELAYVDEILISYENLLGNGGLTSQNNYLVANFQNQSVVNNLYGIPEVADVASFDRYKPKDITLKLDLKKNIVIGIGDGTIALNENDYVKVSESEYKIQASYLLKLIAVNEAKIIFVFDTGKILEVKIPIIDSTPNGSNDNDNGFGSGGVQPPVPPLPEVPKTPEDVKGHWAEKGIAKLISLGAIKGYTDGSFRPDDTITRAEFAKLLVIVFNLKSSYLKNFTDIENHWAKE